MARDIGHEAIALRIVHHVAHEDARLCPVVIVFAQGVGLPHHIAIGVPGRFAAHFGLGRRSAIGIGGIDRIDGILHPHVACARIGMDLRVFGRIHRNLLVIHAQPRAMRIGVGKAASQQHLVGRQTDAGDHIVGFEGELFDLRIPIDRIFVEHQLADFDQRIILMRPDLGQIERIDAIGLGILIGHDLPFERPARVIAFVDRVEQVATVIVAVLARFLDCLVLRQMGIAAFRPDVGVEVEFDPELLAILVDEHVGMAAIAVHLAPVLGHAAIAHQIGHLMCAFRAQRPEIPHHVVIA